MNRAPQELRTYFVTTVTAHRRAIFQVDRNALLFLSILSTQREKGRMQIHAFVVMPDHLHLLLTPAEDVSLEKAMQFLKGGFSFAYKSRMGVWERSFNESQIRAADKFDACQMYIEQNPVRRGLAESASAFAYSSAARPDLVDCRPAHLV